MEEATATAMEREGGRSIDDNQNDRINSIDQSINRQSLDRQSVPSEEGRKEERKEGRKERKCMIVLNLFELQPSRGVTSLNLGSVWL